MESQELSFDETYRMFSRAVLTIYQANHLLKNESEGKTKDELAGIERELFYGEQIANHTFSEMLKKVFPSHLVSGHFKFK